MVSIWVLYFTHHTTNVTHKGSYVAPAARSCVLFPIYLIWGSYQQRQYKPHFPDVHVYSNRMNWCFGSFENKCDSSINMNGYCTTHLLAIEFVHWYLAADSYYELFHFALWFQLKALGPYKNTTGLDPAVGMLQVGIDAGRFDHTLNQYFHVDSGVAESK